MMYISLAEVAECPMWALRIVPLAAVSITRALEMPPPCAFKTYFTLICEYGRLLEGRARRQANSRR